MQQFVHVLYLALQLTKALPVFYRLCNCLLVLWAERTQLSEQPSFPVVSAFIRGGRRCAKRALLRAFSQ